jgi:hypothetical protein
VLGNTSATKKKIPAKKMACPHYRPDNLFQSQLVETFTKLARALAVAYPDDMKAPAVSIVDAAMHTAFPCGRARLLFIGEQRSPCQHGVLIFPLLRGLTHGAAQIATTVKFLSMGKVR